MTRLHNFIRRSVEIYFDVMLIALPIMVALMALDAFLRRLGIIPPGCLFC